MHNALISPVVNKGAVCLSDECRKPLTYMLSTHLCYFPFLLLKINESTKMMKMLDMMEMP